MTEIMLKESVCKSQTDSLKKNIVKIEDEVVRLLNITKTVNLTLMNEIFPLYINNQTILIK